MLNQIGLICSLLGAACVVDSGLKIVRRRAVLLNGVKTRGGGASTETVSSENSDTIIPVIQYEDAAGILYERNLPATHDEKLFKVGKSVDLIYESGNPRNVVDYDCGYQDVYLAMLMSLLFMAFGVVMYAGSTDSTN